MLVMAFFTSVVRLGSIWLTTSQQHADHRCDDHEYADILDRVLTALIAGKPRSKRLEHETHLRLRKDWE